LTGCWGYWEVTNTSDGLWSLMYLTLVNFQSMLVCGLRHVVLWQHLHHLESPKMNCLTKTILLNFPLPLFWVAWNLIDGHIAKQGYYNSHLLWVLHLGRPSYTTTSSNIIFVSPSGRWKVLVTILHFSVKIVTKWWLISI